MKISMDKSAVVITGMDLMQRPLLVFQIDKNLPLCFEIMETQHENIIKIISKKEHKNKR